MSTSLYEILDRLDMSFSARERQVHGLVSVGERENLQNQQTSPAIIRALLDAERYSASHVYFRSFPESERPPQAQVFLYDCTGTLHHKQELAETYRKLWNYGKVVLFYAIYPERVDIFSCFRQPTLNADNQPRYSPVEQLVLTAQAAGDLEELQRFSGRAFDNGSFWENPQNSPLIRRATSAQTTLLEEMRNVRRKVVAEHIVSDPLARRLIVLGLMVRFLEDRDALPTDFFGEFLQGARSFFEVLREPKTLLECVDALAEHFNGDMFHLTDSEKHEIKTADLHHFADAFEGKTSNNQRHFWALYSFADLPVEFVSYLYEDFIKGGTGAVYTPPMLVDLLLDECMPPSALRDTYRILDPACGSGVFLVGAYRRLVEAWQWQNGWKRPPASVLLQLLRDNIFGVDQDPQAVELAIFSLCITLAGHLEADRIWKELRFPKLKGHHLLAQDFFQLIQEDRFTEPFDLIVGNPPFGSEVAGIAREVEQNRTVGGVNFPALPDRQLCYLFLRETPRLLGPEGTGCLILKDGFLYNLNVQEFRTAFLRTFQVPQILDFVSIRHLFKGKSNGKPSDAKVVAVFFENRPPDEKKALLHATFRKVRSVQDHLGFELDAYDFHWLPRHIAREEPLVWKADLLGGGRLLRVYKQFADMGTLGDFLKEKESEGWHYGEGFIVGKRTQKAAFLTGQPYLPSTALTEKEVDELAITSLEDERFQWPREKELYESPHLLIKEHESLPFAYRDDYLTFKHKIVGISCPQQAAPELRKIASYFKEHHRSLRFIVAFSSQYLVNRQAAILKADIDRLPYPENPDDFDFVELEKVLRDDVLDYQIDYIKYGDSLKAEASKDATLKDIRAYAEQFVSLLSTIYDTTHAGDPIDLPTAYCCPFYFGDHPTVEFGDKDALCEHLDALLFHQRRTRLRVCRVTRLFDGNCLFFLKPKPLRFWLRSIAVRDADETFAELRRQGY